LVPAAWAADESLTLHSATGSYDFAVEVVDTPER
jgi:hypothetical protein